MTKLIIAALTFLTVSVFGADLTLNKFQFTDGLITNCPTVLTAGSTSNINAIVETHPGHGIALFPNLVATNGSTSNFVVSVSFARDRTLQNWSTTTRLYTNSLNGITAVAPFIWIPRDDCDSVCAIRINSLQSLDSAFTTTVLGIPFSTRN